jgi:outer membrane biosynthesis protein TonB
LLLLGCARTDTTTTTTTTREDKINDVADFLEDKGFDMAALDALLLDPEEAEEEVEEVEEGEEDEEDEEEDDNEQEVEGEEEDDDQDQQPTPQTKQQPVSKKELTPVEQQEVAKQFQSLKMYQRALEFIVLLGHCVPSVESLLKSKTLSDVVETLRFIRRTYAFGVPSICGLSRSMMVLAWSTKAEVKKELVHTFQELYIAKPGTEGNERLPGDAVAKRLVAAVNGLSDEDELASFEELMKLVVQQSNAVTNASVLTAAQQKKNQKNQRGVISKTTIKTLWAIANRCVHATEADDADDGNGNGSRHMLVVRASESAVKVLAMVASADNSIISSMEQIQTLGQIGFGDATKHRGDWSLAQQACLALNSVPNAGFSSKRTNIHDLKPIVNDIVQMVSSGGKQSAWKQPTSDNKDPRNNEAQWYVGYLDEEPPPPPPPPPPFTSGTHSSFFLLSLSLSLSLSFLTQVRSSTTRHSRHLPSFHAPGRSLRIHCQNIEPTTVPQRRQRGQPTADGPLGTFCVCRGGSGDWSIESHGAVGSGYQETKVGLRGERGREYPRGKHRERQQKEEEEGRQEGQEKETGGGRRIGRRRIGRHDGQQRPRSRQRIGILRIGRP